MARTNSDLALVIAIVLLPLIYLILGVTGTLKVILQHLGPTVPSWLAVGNLVLFPILIAAVGLRAVPVGLAQRGILVLLAFCSVSLALVAYESHPQWFVAMLALVFTEACWLVPRINRVTHPESNADAPPGNEASSD